MLFFKGESPASVTQALQKLHEKHLKKVQEVAEGALKKIFSTYLTARCVDSAENRSPDPNKKWGGKHAKIHRFKELAERKEAYKQKLQQLDPCNLKNTGSVSKILSKESAVFLRLRGTFLKNLSHYIMKEWLRGVNKVSFIPDDTRREGLKLSSNFFTELTEAASKYMSRQEVTESSKTSCNKSIQEGLNTIASSIKENLYRLKTALRKSSKLFPTALQKNYLEAGPLSPSSHDTALVRPAQSVLDAEEIFHILCNHKNLGKNLGKDLEDRVNIIKNIFHKLTSDLLFLCMYYESIFRKQFFFFLSLVLPELPMDLGEKLRLGISRENPQRNPILYPPASNVLFQGIIGPLNPLSKRLRKVVNKSIGSPAGGKRDLFQEYLAKAVQVFMQPKQAREKMFVIFCIFKEIAKPDSKRFPLAFFQRPDERTGLLQLAKQLFFYKDWSNRKPIVHHWPNTAIQKKMEALSETLNKKTKALLCKMRTLLKEQVEFVDEVNPYFPQIFAHSIAFYISEECRHWDFLFIIEQLKKEHPLEKLLTQYRKNTKILMNIEKGLRNLLTPLHIAFMIRKVCNEYVKHFKNCGNNTSIGKNVIEKTCSKASPREIFLDPLKRLLRKQVADNCRKQEPRKEEKDSLQIPEKFRCAVKELRRIGLTVHPSSSGGGHRRVEWKDGSFVTPMPGNKNLRKGTRHAIEGQIQDFLTGKRKKNRFTGRQI